MVAIAGACRTHTHTVLHNACCDHDIRLCDERVGEHVIVDDLRTSLQTQQFVSVHSLESVFSSCEREKMDIVRLGIGGHLSEIEIFK